MKNFCTCKKCKKMKKKGLILGTKISQHWYVNLVTGKPEFYFGPVTDYVPFRKKKKSVDISRSRYIIEL